MWGCTASVDIPTFLLDSGAAPISTVQILTCARRRSHRKKNIHRQLEREREKGRKSLNRRELVGGVGLAADCGGGQSRTASATKGGIRRPASLSIAPPFRLPHPQHHRVLPEGRGGRDGVCRKKRGGLLIKERGSNPKKKWGWGGNGTHTLTSRHSVGFVSSGSKRAAISWTSVSRFSDLVVPRAL